MRGWGASPGACAVGTLIHVKNRPAVFALMQRAKRPSLFSLRYHRCSNLLHAFRDDFRQLHHLLAQCRIFFNLALKAFAISLELSSQPSKLTNKTIDFTRRIFLTPGPASR
jgi:hypothetical protein